MRKDPIFFKFNKVTTLLLLCVFNIKYAATAQELPSADKVTIETERLILRLIDVSDVQDIFELTSDAEVGKLTRKFVQHKNHAETEAFIQSCLDEYKMNYSLTWAVIYKPDNKVIGMISIDSYNPKDCNAKVGYSFSRNYWGKGIATEATEAVIPFGFNTLGLHRICATCDPRNSASRRVLEKSGFQYEGLLRDYLFLRNEFCDRILLSIINQNSMVEKTD